MFDIGHEDDYIIELASEVRKVLESLTVIGASVISHKTYVSGLRFFRRSEGIAMDSA